MTNTAPQTDPTATAPVTTTPRGRHRKPRPHRTFLTVGGLALAAGALGMLRLAVPTPSQAGGERVEATDLDPSASAAPEDRPTGPPTPPSPFATPHSTPKPARATPPSPTAPPRTPARTTAPARTSGPTATYPSPTPTRPVTVETRSTRQPPPHPPAAKHSVPARPPGSATTPPAPPGALCVPIVGLCLDSDTP
ncbi:hypothetical protein ACIRL0_26320 [Streptomyces sp. NPDC102365]|uniref:hypothetical protein n=1 Tax=Streptomyces sp. NPDC102365 TaxID=3366162 RepID=UPI00381B4446